MLLVDCVWEEWDDLNFPRKPDEWSQCTINCWKGTKTQTRKIKSKEQYGGKACNATAEATKTYSCNTDLCPEEIVNQTCRQLEVRNEER